MKFIDAYWEKRNLGLETLEIEIEKNDKDEEFEELLKKSENFQHIVVKLPVGNLVLLHKLEKKGFNFLEAQFEIFRNLKQKITYPEHVKKLLQEVILEKVSGKPGLIKLLERLDERTFSTDRISLDSVFSPKQGQLRYKNWIQDEVKRKGSEIFEFVHFDKKIGFILVHNDGFEKLSGLLGGIYSEYQQGGYGICLIEKPLNLCSLKRKVLYQTRVSSNNLAILKLYFKLQYHVRDIIYVLRKINKGR